VPRPARVFKHSVGAKAISSSSQPYLPQSYQNYEPITPNDTNTLDPVDSLSLSQLSDAENGFNPIASAQGCVWEVFNPQSSFDTIVENFNFDLLTPHPTLIGNNSTIDRSLNQESLGIQDDYVHHELALFGHSSHFFPLPVPTVHQLSSYEDVPMNTPVDESAELDLWTFAGSQSSPSTSEFNVLPVTTELDRTASLNQCHAARVPIHPVTKHNCTQGKCQFTASTLKQLQ
jgi:hypothetical protein